MGHEIENVAVNRGHEVILKIDKENHQNLTGENLKQVDMAMEFSTPATVYQNIMFCIDNGIPVVCGTTGWIDKFEDIRSAVLLNSGAFFWASNYSIGVNLFFKVNKLLSDYIKEIGGYNPRITEIHHTQKLDAPSGTAITLANIISGSIKSFKGWSLLPDKSDNKIPIESIREGIVPGTHIVTFDSEKDEITLVHKAKNRKGFALGAVLAAEFLLEKKGIYSMDDLLKL